METEKIIIQSKSNTKIFLIISIILILIATISFIITFFTTAIMISSQVEKTLTNNSYSIYEY